MKLGIGQKYTAAFTLVELIITITIVSVLVALSAPAMLGFSNNQRLVGAVTDLAADIQYARSEAVARKTSVQICPSTNGAGCASTDDWASGWIVQITDASRCPAVGDCILKSRDAINSAVTLNASVNTGVNFDEQGAASSNVTFALCLDGDSASATAINQRTLSVRNSGSRFVRKGAATCDP